MPGQVFEGLKAVGFVYAGVGTMLLRVLANHGATTIRVESMTRLDNLRVASPYKDNTPGINRSYYFSWPNADRLSLQLNLKHPRAPEVTKELIAWADILVENFAPGVVASWGLSYEEVKKINPGIIMISASQMGQTGPHKQLAGYGPLLQGLAGFVNLTGWPDRFPVLVDRSYPDLIAPRYGVVAVIAALDYKRRTGKGQYIDIAQYEASIEWLAPTILDYSANQRIQTRNGNKNPMAAPHGAYRCQGDDRWCAITVFADAEWEAFCKVIGNPLWTKEPKFSTLLGRKQHEDELNKLVQEWTVNHTAEEVMTLMQQAGVKAGVVQTVEDVVEKDPQLKHRHYFWKLNHPELGETIYVRPSYLLSKTPARVSQPAPILGEHTEHICKDLLGMSEEEFISLLIEDVFN